MSKFILPSARRGILPILLISTALLLSACKSSEEKAEDYFRSGMEFVAAGDNDRALVEFRNVFKYNGFHKEARKTYADIQFSRGIVGEAYSQYLRLIEQYPDTPEVRQILAEIAISRGDWAEAERHGRAAIALRPDEPAIQAIAVALEYRQAIMDKDKTAVKTAADKARALLQQDAENKVARRIVIDDLMNSDDQLAALPEVEHALSQEPNSLELHIIKFTLLTQKGDPTSIGTQLRTMFDLFPDNEKVRSALIGWYIQQKDFDGAEAFLRKLAGDDTAAPEGHIAVIQLLQTVRGKDAARAEMDRLITANAGQPNADIYAALRATSLFEAGQKTEAIAAMEEILKTAAPSDQTRRIKGMLAKMLEATGNQVGARARVEEILAEDGSNVEALKMRAGWLIEEDKPGAAIIDLRSALNQNPRDPETLTLMAQAHERDGSPELAGERLALAVEVSGSGANEALRYARFLQRQGRTSVAQNVLIDARRANPGNPEILAQLGRLWLAAENWDGVQDVIDSLQELQTPATLQEAAAIEAAMLLRQNRTDDGIAFLQSQIDNGGEDARAVAVIIQAYMRNGKTDDARRYMDEALAKDPNNADLQIINAGLYTLANDEASAERVYRDLIAKNPSAELPVKMLYTLLTSLGRSPEASQLLDAGLKAQPKSTVLRWMKAGEVERAGDIAAAVAIYEELYAQDTNNVVIANNLASLISTHFDDAASLERAFAIARRLNGSNVPAFQDTYGWIEYRRGNLDEALRYLDPAAAGLPSDPLTQFHLGMTFAGLKRIEDARRVLTRALELAGDSPLPQFQTARETLATLGSP